MEEPTRSAVYHGNHQLKIVDVPEPAAWAEQVKVRVSRNGICGTDLHEYSAGPIFIPLSEPHPLTGKKIPLVFRARILRHRHGSRRRGDRRARG